MKVATAWPWLLCAALALLVVRFHADYGVTWDEGVQQRYGELAIGYFRGETTLEEIEALANLRYYGVLAELPAGLLSGLPPRELFERRHLLLGLMALLVVPALAAFGTRLAGMRAAGLAVVALFMMPAFVGHLHNNSKDVPFAVAISVYFAALARYFGASSARRVEVVLLGLALGVVLAVRPGGLLLAFALLVCATLLAFVLRPPRVGAQPPLGLALELASVLALAWVVMVLPWPWAHPAPLSRPIEAIRQAASFPFKYAVLFEGQSIGSDALPRRYLPTYLAITTPPALLGLALLGLARLGRRLWRAPRAPERFGAWLLLAWLAVPLAAYFVLKPNVYDGLRHFLFLLPPLALLAGLGADAVLSGLAHTPARLPSTVIVGALLLSPSVELVALHPYQYTYFNAFVGGLPGARGRFETDYWATSFREAMLWIASQRAPGDVRPEIVLLGASSMAKPAAVTYAPDGVRVMLARELAALGLRAGDADYYLAPTRFGLEQRYPQAPIVYTVSRQGVPFAVVKRIRGVVDADEPIGNGAADASGR